MFVYKAIKYAYYYSVSRSLSAARPLRRSLAPAVARPRGRSVARPLGRVVTRSLDRSAARLLGRLVEHVPKSSFTEEPDALTCRKVTLHKKHLLILAPVGYVLPPGDVLLEGYTASKVYVTRKLVRWICFFKTRVAHDDGGIIVVPRLLGTFRYRPLQSNQIRSLLFGFA